ncbi:MAG: MBL fold metallo-hydrolase [Treponema sp.]|jgi:glyoxylase-like metal-dependent hydrolase (beta-lactamase superfamily II)|nr:MBL fold metallo-hydrolase [Treponema sp.]
MKVFFHYCSYGFSNCYILGTEPLNEGAPKRRFSGEAIIIDPGNMDEAILNFIEHNNYRLLGVLITHDHPNHVHGLRTLKRIYDVDIYAVNRSVLDQKTIMVKDGEVFDIGSFHIEAITVPGHSADSAVYKIEHLLFTGDALNAGLLGTTASSYGAEVQMSALRTKLFSLPGNYGIFPGHGPPSTLEVEKRFNAGIQFFEKNKSKRRTFNVDIRAD